MPLMQDDPDLSAVWLYSTIARACECRRRAPKKRRIPCASAARAISVRKSIGYLIDGAVP